MKESSPSTSEVVESRLPSPHLINLHRDILYLILEKLDGVSLVNLSCCCKLLRAFGTDPASARVWAALVRRRWRNVNTLPYTRAASTPRRPAEPYSSKGSGLAPDSNADTSDSAAGSTAAKDASSSIQPDWKRLYSQENGWKGRLGVARLGDSYGGYCFGLHLFKSSDLGWDFPGGSAENEFVLATISDNQEDWIAGWTFSSTPPGNQDLSCGPDWVRDAYSWVSHRHASPRLSGPVLALPDKPLVAIGATAGTVCLEEPYGCQLRRVRQLHTGNARCARSLAPTHVDFHLVNYALLVNLNWPPKVAKGCERLPNSYGENLPLAQKMHCASDIYIFAVKPGACVRLCTGGLCDG